MEYSVNYKTDSNLVSWLSMPAANSGSIMSGLEYTYDNFDRLTEKVISMSSMVDLSEEYEYYTYIGADGERHTTSLVSSVTLNGANPNDELVYTYTYDNLGNITAVSIHGIHIESYEYDSLGQLIREDNVLENYTKLYEYDKAGNIRYTSVMPYTSAPSANIAFAEGSILPYGYSTSAWGDLLTSYGGTSISYDAIGNPTKWCNSSSMSWDARRLTNQRMNNSDWLTYTYNADGIRTQKYYFNDVEMYGTTHDYVLDGTKIIRETVTGDGNNYTLYYLYDESGSVQGFIYNNAYYYYQKNLQGDVVRIVNAGGTVVVEYTYDAWGNVLSVTGSLADTIGHYNPFRYRSYYYDSETGFYYLQSRYYDPVVGRFLNADAIIGANGGIQGYNMFAYCNNNPVMFYDYFGYCKTMWGEGAQGPCPGPGKCSDFDYDSYFEQQRETTGRTQPVESNTKSKECNGKSPSVNTYTNDETPNSTEFSIWYDSTISSSQMILSYVTKNSSHSLIDEYMRIVDSSSKSIPCIGGGIVIAMDISTGLYQNIENNSSVGKTLYDFGVDTVISGGGVAASMYFGAAAGTAIYPVVGTVIGAVVSVLWYIAFDVSGARNEIKSWVE